LEKPLIPPGRATWQGRDRKTTLPFSGYFFNISDPFMNGKILKILLLFAGLVYGESSAGRVTTIRGAPCVAGELIVRFRSENIAPAAAQAALRRHLGRHYQGQILHHFRSGAEHWRIARGGLEVLLDSLNQLPEISYAEPNYILSADLLPDDPALAQQWALINNGQTGGTPDADIDADGAWEISTGSPDILIGVVDSGIDETHPDLTAAVWTNPGEIPGNGLDDDANGYVDDVHGYDFLEGDNTPQDENGHGSHVSGIIGAVSDNGLGIAGVAWRVKLLPLKFLNENNSGPTTAAITAIEYAIDSGVDLINASWGSTSFSQALADVIATAGLEGILFIASAGNSSSDNDLYPHYPSSYELDNIISVASTDHNDKLSSFSNWGVRTVDLAAPGTAIYSTLPDTGYGAMSGTSMAAPFVSGALVLARAVFPQMTASELKTQLLTGVDLKADLVGLIASAGRLNALALIERPRLPLLNTSPPAIDFSLVRIEEQTAGITVVLTNLSPETMIIDSAVVQEGFLIRRSGEWQTGLGGFAIDALSTDSLMVCFAPQQEDAYHRLLNIYYHTGDRPSEMVFTQLSGRGVSGTIVAPGPVSGIWRIENEPYYIMGDIMVGSGLQLTIEAGVRVQFEGHFRFSVEGSGVFRALGTENDSIRFYPYDTRSGWNGLRLIDTGSDDTLRYCTLSHAHKSGELAADEDGGGLYISASSPDISHTLIYHNSAGGGGGISCFDAHPTITHVSIQHNTSGSGGGGGMACIDSKPLLQHVTITDNLTMSWLFSSDNGGGLYCRRSGPTLINVTISGNQGEKGGGIYISQSPSAPVMINSICWGNAPEEICFSEEPRSKSIAIAYSDIEGGMEEIGPGSGSMVFWLQGNLAVDPLFWNKEEADFRLTVNSPCIDAGIQDTIILYNDNQDSIVVPIIPYNRLAPDMGALESDGGASGTLSLSSGWNLISWNKETASLPPAERFEGILSGLDVVLSFDGEGLTYDPRLEPEFNNLAVTDNLHGYWIRMLDPDHLFIPGDPVQLPVSLILDQGWNLISYLPVFADSTHLALASILENLIIAEGFDDGALSFSPAFPDSVNTLHILLPGYGYWFKLAAPDTLIYYEKDLPVAEQITLAAVNNLYQPSDALIPTSNWMSVYASTMLSGDISSSGGLKLSARDPDGILCGEMMISEAGFIKMMPIYGDDIRTTDIDEGALPGDSIAFFIGDRRLPVKLAWQPGGQSEDICDYITGLGQQLSGINPFSYQLFQNSPNPFNNHCLISFQIRDPVKVTIEVYNILGQKVKTLLEAHKRPGNYQLIWDGCDESALPLSSGLYFYRMIAGDFRSIKKMIIIK